MNKELIDRAWACLPREFKEKVKKEYYHDDSNPFELAQLEAIFGIHNLTSDGKGEDEMLCVSRKQIDALQGEIFKAIMDAHDADDWQDAAHYILDVMPRSFAALFGSKCLPDELNEDNFATKKPQPAEPKNEGTHQEQCVPKNAESGTHSFSHILKDDFRNERRLNIAAQILGGIVASGKPCRQPVKRALELTDTLVAECEKGGDNA